MSKKFKRLSAVILAVVMMLGSTVMASAATMHVYIREWEQGTSSNTYLGTPKPIPGSTDASYDKSIFNRTVHRNG